MLPTEGEAGPDLTDFNVSPDSIPADGSTRAEVSATVPEAALGGVRKVTFTSEAGTFAGTASTSQVIAIDENGLASTHLIASLNPLTVTVKAIAGHTVKSRTIKFTRAFADTILVAPSKFVVGSEEEIAITASLRRVVGTPSPGAEVTFVALDTLGRSVGTFGTSSLSNDSGQVTVRFSPIGAIRAAGIVRIKATTKSQEGRDISGLTTISVASPSNAMQGSAIRAFSTG